MFEGQGYRSEFVSGGWNMFLSVSACYIIMDFWSCVKFYVRKLSLQSQVRALRSFTSFVACMTLAVAVFWSLKCVSFVWLTAMVSIDWQVTRVAWNFLQNWRLLLGNWTGSALNAKCVPYVRKPAVRSANIFHCGGDTCVSVCSVICIYRPSDWSAEACFRHVCPSVHTCQMEAFFT